MFTLGSYASSTSRLAGITWGAEDIAAARAALDQAEASVVESERRLVDSQLLAPSDGVVLTRAREPGAIVAAGDTVFAVTLSTPVWVRAYVDEADLGRIHPGMVAQVTSDSAPGKVYRARIGFIVKVYAVVHAGVGGEKGG